MTPIFPSTALKNQQREIKKLADTQLVYITENGRGKYVFTSHQIIADAVEDALYEQRLSDALAESRDDFKNGQYYTSRESLMAAVNAKREARA